MRPRLLVRSAAFLFAALGLIVSFSGCDSAPGAGDLIPNPPTLSDFSFTPLEFLHTGSGDTAQIPLQIEVTVANPSGGILTVDYFVRAEFSTELVASGTLPSAGGTRYAGGEMLSIPRGETGLFVITVTVVDDAGAVGNEVRGLLQFSAESLGPPVIDDVVFPATVTRPTGPVCNAPPANTDGNPAPVPFQIVATVSDPDGSSNVNRVEADFKGTDFDMRDDGGVNSNSGDETAGDGRYTVTFQVECWNVARDIDFIIRATDRSAQESDPVDITITIE